MVEDANKHITNISYNHLNLPKQITITGLSVAAQGTIDYLYAANGIKLRKKVDAVSGIQIDYVGSFYYEDSSLKFVNHAEGYLEESRSGWQYVYQYKDHLGNIRLSYSDLDGNGSIDTGSEILEENNYYPFGLKHEGYNNNPITNHPYKYNSKELNEELGLDWYDFGARNYDAALGRWMNVDPLAENSRRWTPYNYAYNNPLVFVDPDGMDVINGYHKSLKEAKSSLDEAQNNFDSIDKETNKKAWREAKSNLAKANKNFKTIKNNYDKVEKIISDYSNVDLESFNKLDNLRDLNGNDVDVYVQLNDSYDESFTRADGAKGSLDGATYALPLGIGGIKSPQNGDNTITITLGKNPNAAAFAEEVGHSLWLSNPRITSIGGKSKETTTTFWYYSIYLEDNPDKKRFGGHAPGDPNGIAGDKARSDYYKNKKKKK